MVQGNNLAVWPLGAGQIAAPCSGSRRPKYEIQYSSHSLTTPTLITITASVTEFSADASRPERFFQPTACPHPSAIDFVRNRVLGQIDSRKGHSETVRMRRFHTFSLQRLMGSELMGGVYILPFCSTKLPSLPGVESGTGEAVGALPLNKNRQRAIDMRTLYTCSAAEDLACGSPRSKRLHSNSDPRAPTCTTCVL